MTGEYDDLEFKEQEIDVHILAKHILGIANTAGGIICLGVKESEDGLIPIGLDNSSDSTDLKKKLSKYLPYNLDYEIHPIDYDDNELWLIYEINHLKLSLSNTLQKIFHSYQSKVVMIMKKLIFFAEKIPLLIGANMMIYKIFLINE